VYISNSRRKSEAVFLVFFILFLLFILRLCYIQFFRSNYLSELADKQHNLFVELEPVRGTIYDSASRPQAINLAADSLYASPRDIKDKEAVIKKLSGILGSSYAYLKDRLYRNKSFIWVARKVTPEQSQAIKNLKIKGLGFIKESKRTYPNSYLASHIIGFAGMDNSGLEATELNYDIFLKGQPGWAVFLRDARQKRLDLWQKMVLPKDGFDLVLTIDEVIQYIAERELDKAFKKYHAKGASIIVMDPYTGAILALANRPTYDLNNPSGVTKDKTRDRAIADMFEPGSVFKIVTASAALEEKKVTEEDKFFCENGSYRVGAHVLHDHTKHGLLTFREVIEQSSNIGTVKVAQILGPQIIYKYMKLYGFGSKTGIDLIGEISGVAKEPRQWSKISIASIPIGQEVGATAIQLACAMSVIANGGNLMKPYVVSAIKSRDGEMVKKFGPQVRNKAISADTSARMTKMLTGVIEEGTGKMAKLIGFSAAGKTGTAQKIEPNGRYSHSKYIASFVGFAPAEEPIITVVVMVDEPRPVYFGGVVAAPVFKNVAGDVIRYLKTKPVSRQEFVLNESTKITR
jgi:cell division protein FtsI (penicillin-binding protein 3)